MMRRPTEVRTPSMSPCLAVFRRGLAADAPVGPDSEHVPIADM